MKYARILQAIASMPWAMQPDKLGAMLDIIIMRAEGTRLTSEEISSRIEAARMSPRQDRKVAGQPGNLAVVPMRGVVSNRAPLVEDVSTGGGCNVETFQTQFREALAAQDVKAIIVDIDTPGGSVFGVPEMAAEMRAARGEKPIIGHINALCASAGYWMGSACDELVITPSGEAGSIGVYSMHDDVSKWLEEMGVTRQFISAGKYKVEGNPYEPLGDEAREALQSSVNAYYDMFVDDVASNRGVKVSEVRNGYGQGRCLDARTALAEGLVDRIATFDETLERFGISRRPASNQAGRSAHRARARDRELDLIAAE